MTRPSHPKPDRPPRVLIADDQPDIIDALRLLLKGEGYGCESAASPRAALEAVESALFDSAIIDLNYARDTTSGSEGLDLLEGIRRVDAALPVIVMTAWGTIDLAVDAMRRGARDFVQKPWENARMIAIVRSQVELCRALRRGERLEAENRLLRAEGRPALIAESDAMRAVLRLVTRVAPTDANVLITGEHGTGKEVVARTVHALSARAGRGMVTVNIGGLAEGVFESELFGHVRGAFTGARADRMGRFEAADGVTLFLDEIANITPMQQARLLRVLESGEIERVGSSRTRSLDVRVLSATNADLHDEVAEGRFREDLLFRLNTVEIHVPPLRDRPADVAPLAEHFLGVYGGRYKKTLRGFEPGAVELLERHAWRGNVRELDHAVERAVILAGGERIAAADLSLDAAAGPVSLEEMSLDAVEAFLIRKSLARHDGNVSLAAASLGLSRSALYRRIERHGI